MITQITAVTMKNKTCGNSFVGLAYNATSKKCSIKIKSTRYNIRSYMDPRFTGMEPVPGCADARYPQRPRRQRTAA